MGSDRMPRICFVASPIGDEGTPMRAHADWLLDEIIAPVFVQHFKDFEVVRADRIAQPGMIDSQVINYLLTAELVIADLSFQNPNVFYEVGLRHMEQKPIIHMFLAGEVIPFDVKPYRAIPFALQHPKQLSEARDLLKKAVEAGLDKNYKVENPVTRARGYVELSKHAMPGQEVILAEIESLKKDVQVAYMAAASAQSMAQLALNPIRAGTSGGFGSSFNSGGGFSGVGSRFATSDSGDLPPGSISANTPLVLRGSEKKK